MMFCVKRVGRAGFTLIEIMIVIAIIAILAGIVVPNFVQAKAEAQLQACRQNILNIFDACQMVLARKSPVDVWIGTGRSYSGMTVVSLTADVMFPYLVENGYLNNVPKCPLGGPGVNGYLYMCNLGPSAGVMRYSSYIFCCGGRTTGTDGHIVGNQRIRPMFFCGYGTYGSGFNDGVYDL